MYHGVAAGIFCDAGIDLQITGLANSGAIAEAITGGSFDRKAFRTHFCTGTRVFRGIPTSFTQFATLEWLKKNGVDPSSVKFVELPYPAMQAAMEAGRIDAALLAEPAMTVALSSARVFADPNAAIAPTWFVSAYFPTETLIAKNLALAHWLTRAIVHTAVWSNTHQAQTALVLEKITQVPHDVVSRSSSRKCTHKCTYAWNKKEIRRHSVYA